MREGMETRNDEVFSKAIRAGKRTYFFDIKSTRGNDLYLTITESKRKTPEGNQYEKHKIFLYKEDFDKFSEGLKEVLEKITELRESQEYALETSDDLANINFEDL